MAARAYDPNSVGVALLKTVVTNIDGSGIRIAQPEGYDTSSNTWEVDPSVVYQPESLFSYASSSGTSTVYPNSIGYESHHAEYVGNVFYGSAGGIATNVAHVDNYDANYFYNSIVAPLLGANINDRIANQSFVFGAVSASEQQALDSAYDNYATRCNTLFVSGVGNGGQVMAPGTCYNGIGVAVYGSPSSIGPTIDNGRCKPDITAPEAYSSFSTPQVSGVAAVLMQAGLRGDGGPATVSAADMRTVKALLLNGAVKPADWTNGTFSPLDARYGAGILNAFNSYEQLAQSNHAYTAFTSVPLGNPHPPIVSAGSVDSLIGWDFNTNSSGTTNDGVNHYLFNVTNGTAGATFTATVTLVWNRQQNTTAINDLDLFLYDANSSNLIAASTSPVDNVEHLFVRNLPPGRYDLQVLKNGGPSNGGQRVTKNETYALAFEFFSESLAITLSGGNAVITWPLYPDGFVLDSTTNLQAPVLWSTNNPAPSVTNGQNQVVVSVVGGNQFFRLERP